MGEGATDIMSQVSTGMINGITNIASNMGTFIVSVLPVILPIVGAVIVIGFGIKLFRKFAK